MIAPEPTRIGAIETHLLATVRVVLVGGGPGTGKTTVARGVSEAIGGTWLCADETRKDLAGVPHGQHAFAEKDQGIYTPEMNARTRAELTRQAAQLLQRGESVVLDSTWWNAEDREAIRVLAAGAGAELTEIRCVLPPDVARERIARRLSSLFEPSDATPDLVDIIGERFDAWPEATEIDTRASLATSVGSAVDAVLRRRSANDRQHRNAGPQACPSGGRR